MSSNQTAKTAAARPIYVTAMSCGTYILTLKPNNAESRIGAGVYDTEAEAQAAIVRVGAELLADLDERGAPIEISAADAVAREIEAEFADEMKRRLATLAHCVARLQERLAKVAEVAAGERRFDQLNPRGEVQQTGFEIDRLVIEIATLERARELAIREAAFVLKNV